MYLRRVLISLLVGTVINMWMASVYFYGQLPARFPTHFDAQGVPDHFAPKSLGMWFALPVTFTVITAVFVAMAVFLPSLAAKYSRFVNVPDKQKFLSLPVEARIRVLEPMRDLSLMMPVPLAVLATFMSWGSTQVALGHASSISPFPILVVLISSFVLLGVTVNRMQRAIDAEGAS